MAGWAGGQDRATQVPSVSVRCWAPGATYWPEGDEGNDRRWSGNRGEGEMGERQGEAGRGSISFALQSR